MAKKSGHCLKVVEVSEVDYFYIECFGNMDSYGVCEYCSGESIYLDEDTYYSRL